jgi:hypothetical protein
MESNKHAKATLTGVTMTTVTLLVLAIITIAPPQQVDGLSGYDIGAAAYDAGPATIIANKKTDQTLQQDDIGNTVKPIPTTTPTSPTVPIVGCAMDTIESLQSFLSCLGAK